MAIHFIPAPVSLELVASDAVAMASLFEQIAKIADTRPTPINDEGRVQHQ